MFIYGGTCNIFVTFGDQKRVNCTFSSIFGELLGSTAKFLWSKNEYIAFLRDPLVPTFLLKTSFLQFQTCQGCSAGAKIGSPKQVGFMTVAL